MSESSDGFLLKLVRYLMKLLMKRLRPLLLLVVR